MKKILVVEREYGAGGSVIAERTAQRLGWKLLDQELTQAIAKLAKVKPEICADREERVNPWLYNLAKVFWRGSHERSLPLPDVDIVDADRLVCLAKQVVEQAAETGNCVIVGRGAAYFLRDRPDKYCVFLYAPRDVKFRRVLAEVKDENTAIDLVDKVDEQRAEFIKHYFNAPWPSRHLYDAMINTAIGDDASVEMILNLLKAADQRETP